MTVNQIFYKQYSITLILVVVSLMFYSSFAYDLIRTDYIKLLGLYFGLFYLFYSLIKRASGNLKLFTYVAFLFRAVFILSVPNLSQDFYRFIWDGRLILEGLNPYLYTVDSLISSNQISFAQAQDLYEGMGQLNASHYSNYPPLNQLCFVIAGLFAGKSIIGSVVVLRLLIIAADFGTLYYGRKLLKLLYIEESKIFWYILNPFIIIELTGNLHFEGVMIFFLVWSIYLLFKGKWYWSAIIFALSVSIKLIPLIFLPLLYQWFKNEHHFAKNIKPFLSSGATIRTNFEQKKGNGSIKKLLIYYLIVAMVSAILFLPFMSTDFFTNYAQTIGLWFEKFEFNASIYYIAREIGYWIYGYNQIAFLGKFFAACTILFVAYYSYIKKMHSTIDFLTAFLLVLSFYYFTSTTIHPWYVATLLFISLFTNYKFPLIWSLVIVLSYLAYLNLNTSDKSENLAIIALEYIIVYGALLWDILKQRKHTEFQVSIQRKNQ